MLAPPFLVAVLAFFAFFAPAFFLPFLPLAPGALRFLPLPRIVAFVP